MCSLCVNVGVRVHASTIAVCRLVRVGVCACECTIEECRQACVPGRVCVRVYVCVCSIKFIRYDIVFAHTSRLYSSANARPCSTSAGVLRDDGAPEAAIPAGPCGETVIPLNIPGPALLPPRTTNTSPSTHAVHEG